MSCQQTGRERCIQAAVAYSCSTAASSAQAEPPSARLYSSLSIAFARLSTD